MELNDLLKLSATILASIGGAGVIILALSSWLGKVWANRLMESQKHENQVKLTKLSEEIKAANSTDLEKLRLKLELFSHSKKLGVDHEYEQKKKIKEVISKYKVVLIESAESLNHRIWNLNTNLKEMWHEKKDIDIEEQYYLYSFVYRFIAFYAWCRVAEKNMIFLDSTVADNEDLDFVKFLKLLPQTMCDVSLFKGLEYDRNEDKDHFFTNTFQEILEQIQMDTGILSFVEFKEKLSEEDIDVSKVIDFISGICPEEERFRWFRLQSMHYALLLFLNNFGYDFQKTDIEKIRELRTGFPDNPTLSNLVNMFVNLKLDKNIEVRAFLDTIHQ